MSASLSANGWYLIWSHEHGGWWGQGDNGYTRDPAKAGRYTRIGALGICMRAAHEARKWGALPEVPVPEADIEQILTTYKLAFERDVDFGPDGTAAPGFRGTYPT